MVYLEDTRIVLVRSKCPYVQLGYSCYWCLTVGGGYSEVEREVGPQVSVGVLLTDGLTNVRESG